MSEYPIQAEQPGQVDTKCWFISFYVVWTFRATMGKGDADPMSETAP